jgi:hypothetical protein
MSMPQEEQAAPAQRKNLKDKFIEVCHNGVCILKEKRKELAALSNKARTHMQDFWNDPTGSATQMFTAFDEKTNHRVSGLYDRVTSHGKQYTTQYRSWRKKPQQSAPQQPEMQPEQTELS